MPIPSRLLQALAGLWLALGFLAAFVSSTLPVWILAGASLAVFALADLFALRRRGCPITVERELLAAWPIGVSQAVTLLLSGPRFAARRAPILLGRFGGRFFDHVPGSFATDGLPGRFEMVRGAARLDYRATARARGQQQFGPLEVLLDSPVRFWRGRYRLDASGASEVRVYPDFARIAHYALLATDHRLSQIGLLLRRRRGEGLEFHQLREYRHGDSPRDIDWKASARHRKLIAREYQDERNQQIMFLLDCGQRMHTREADERGDAAAESGRVPLSHFDHALNAMLLLSYVALRQGDGVGLATFAHPAPRFCAPRRSLTALTSLMESVYDLEPTALTPDYLAACGEASTRVRKRSLMLVLSNLRDEDDDTLFPALTLLKRNHLVVVASLREPGLTETRQRPVRTFDDALTYAAASEYLFARQRSSARLRSMGVESLEVTPAQLPIALVNYYWRIKRSGML